MKRAVCLLSGGLDSSVTLAAARSQGYETFALTVDYGQRHKREIDAARQVARALGAKSHRVIKVPLSDFGGNALTDPGIRVPTPKSEKSIGRSIPATYVPARNIIFLSIAYAYAETVGASAVFIGANAVDYSGYPDCRPKFLNAFVRMITLGTKNGSKIRLRAPLLRKTKAQIVALGKRLGAPLELTWSCYTGGERPCGKCESCILRAKGFRTARTKDGALARAGRKNGNGNK